MSGDVSLQILEIINRAMEIEIHFRDSNEIKLEHF